jgi:spore germination protein GerM
MSERRSWLALATLVITALIAACGIDESSSPTVLDDSNLPCVLSDDCDATNTSVDGDATQRVSVFFVRRGREETHLEDASRDVASRDVEAALEALFESPPTDQEREDGLTTNIPDQAMLRDVTELGEGVVLVNLSEGFENVTGQGQRVAYAQIVWTATDFPEVEGVAFAVEGEPKSAITGNGSPKDDPVRRSDYAAFRPE